MCVNCYRIQAYIIKCFYKKKRPPRGGVRTEVLPLLSAAVRADAPVTRDCGRSRRGQDRCRYGRRIAQHHISQGPIKDYWENTEGTSRKVAGRTGRPRSLHAMCEHSPFFIHECTSTLSMWIATFRATTQQAVSRWRHGPKPVAAVEQTLG